MAKLSGFVLASLTVAAFGCRHPEFIGAPLEWGGYPQPCSDAGAGLDDELRLLVGGYHNKFREYLVHGYIPGQGEGHQSCRNVYTLKYSCEIEPKAVNWLGKTYGAPACGIEKLAAPWPSTDADRPNDTLPYSCGDTQNPRFLKHPTKPELFACSSNVAYTKTYKKGEYTKRQFIVMALHEMWVEARAQLNHTFWDHLTFGQILYGSNYAVGCGIIDCPIEDSTLQKTTFVCAYGAYHDDGHWKAKYIGPAAEGMHCTPGYTCEQGRVCRPGRDCNVDDCDYMDGAAYVGNLSPACNNVTGLCDHTQMQFAFAAGQWSPRTTCYQMSNTTCQYNQQCVLDPNSNCKCKKCISNGPLCYE